MSAQKNTPEKAEEYQSLVHGLGHLIESSRTAVHDAIRMALLHLYWQIGKNIVEFEQKGKTRAAYRTELLIQLSKDLHYQYGKGFSASNLYNMRLFYEKYPIFQTSGKLTWGHYCELVGIDNELERSFSKYQLYLPNEAELRAELEQILSHP
jgi:hypothetical protein